MIHDVRKGSDYNIEAKIRGMMSLTIFQSVEGPPIARDDGDDVRDEARVRPGRQGGGARLYVQPARHPEQQHDPWCRRLRPGPGVCRGGGGPGGAPGPDPGQAGEVED